MATSPMPNTDMIPVPGLNLQQVEDLLKLQKAAQKISSILDLDELIEKVVNDVARSFGCLESNLYLFDEQSSTLVLAGVHGCSVHSKGKCWTLAQGMIGYVASTGQMRYAPDVNKDPYYVACEASTRSELAIPLLLEGKLVGVFTASHHALDAFPPEQLRSLQALCSHIAVAVHNARRFQQERRQREQMDRDAAEARVIQQALLPKSSPYLRDYAVSGVSLSAGAVGGDWYDFIPFEDGRVGLVLADVSGKGMAAALLMSATRGMVRSLAQTCCSPAEVLDRLNRLMVQDFPTGRFVTMVYGILDPATRTLRFASAGHLPPLLVEGSSSRFLVAEAGMPLGLLSGEFSETEVSLPPGSRLVFYSDGITEASHEDEEFGLERLAMASLQEHACPDTILADVRSFVNGAGLQDDATVIMVSAK
ncbi:MAG TPA: GAF domain-containing SpoIIE family protein phosphatase [Terriglobales bacterium]|nr:GAF domain-containing SpoIIE family protein phosphatase [Terriglobales bacterium]